VCVLESGVEKKQVIKKIMIMPFIVYIKLYNNKVLISSFSSLRS